MIELTGNTEGLSRFIGSVGGILNAIQSPAFQGDFARFTLGRLKKQFMIDTIAANEAGTARLKHVFEWPDTDQRGVAMDDRSSIPLFKLKITGARELQTLSFDFLPSVRQVPLPDPDYYGFKPEKLSYLRRHTFPWKAVVMETQSQVVVEPRGSKKLFIPTTSSDEGYIMTSKSVEINPGGYQATGGFAEWWMAWFAGPANAHVEMSVNAAEEMIAATGRKVLRYAAGTVIDGKKVGGQFAAGKQVTMAYVEASERTAEIEMKIAAERLFDEDDWDDE